MWAPGAGGGLAEPCVRRVSRRAWRRVASHESEWLAAEFHLAKSLLGQLEGKAAEAERVPRNLHEVRMRVLGAAHPDTLSTSGALAVPVSHEVKYSDAERIERELVGVMKRVLGAEHPATLTSAGNLALSLSDQGKYAEAEQIQLELLGVRKRVLGAEHPATLTRASNLVLSLSDQGQYADAERMHREVLGVRKRVLGAEHPHTLMSASNLSLAMSLSDQGNDAEAEQMQRDVLGAQKRVLGAEHPATLTNASNLAMSLSDQGQHTEAEQMLHATLASSQRMLGPAHTTTLRISSCLKAVRARIRAAPSTRTQAAAPAALTAARPLPAGMRVLVQQLIAKPEHNGKLARVLSLDAHTDRYVVALEGGKELLLKAECVARAECAAVGCALEEASNVCSRCKAVRYCSRECQRADWQAHKGVCAVAQADVRRS